MIVIGAGLARTGTASLCQVRYLIGAVLLEWALSGIVIRHKWPDSDPGQHRCPKHLS